jgi:hypothetical protein
MVETAAGDADVLATASKMETYKRVHDTGRLIQEVANYSQFGERRATLLQKNSHSPHPTFLK